MNCHSLETCSAHDIIDDLDLEFDLMRDATRTSWKATLQPLAHEKLRASRYLYQDHGSEWIKVFNNYRIPFVIHLRFAGFDTTLPTRRPLGLGCRTERDDQPHPQPAKPSWPDFVWELATRCAEPWNPDAPQNMAPDAYKPMPLDFLYTFSEGRWHRFDKSVEDVRAHLFSTLRALEEEGKLRLEPGEHPDGDYRILQPIPLPERAWTD